MPTTMKALPETARKFFLNTARHMKRSCLPEDSSEFAVFEEFLSDPARVRDALAARPARRRGRPRKAAACLCGAAEKAG